MLFRAYVPARRKSDCVVLKYFPEENVCMFFCFFFQVLSPDHYHWLLHFIKIFFQKNINDVIPLKVLFLNCEIVFALFPSQLKNQSVFHLTVPPPPPPTHPRTPSPALYLWSVITQRWCRTGLTAVVDMCAKDSTGPFHIQETNQDIPRGDVLASTLHQHTLSVSNHGRSLNILCTFSSC